MTQEPGRLHSSAAASQNLFIEPPSKDESAVQKTASLWQRFEKFVAKHGDRLVDGMIDLQNRFVNCMTEFEEFITELFSRKVSSHAGASDFIFGDYGHFLLSRKGNVSTYLEYMKTPGTTATPPAWSASIVSKKGGERFKETTIPLSGWPEQDYIRGESRESRLKKYNDAMNTFANSEQGHLSKLPLSKRKEYLLSLPQTQAALI